MGLLADLRYNRTSQCVVYSTYIYIYAYIVEGFAKPPRQAQFCEACFIDEFLMDTATFQRSCDGCRSVEIEIEMSMHPSICKYPSFPFLSWL